MAIAAGMGASTGPDDLLPVYPVWVAEVMLQQTRLAVALPFWRRWLERFPDLGSLAAASRQDVLHQEERGAAPFRGATNKAGRPSSN